MRLEPSHGIREVRAPICACRRCTRTSRRRRASSSSLRRHYTRAAHPRPLPQRSTAEHAGRSRRSGSAECVELVAVLTAAVTRFRSRGVVGWITDTEGVSAPLQLDHLTERLHRGAHRSISTRTGTPEGKARQRVSQHFVDVTIIYRHPCLCPSVRSALAPHVVILILSSRTTHDLSGSGGEASPLRHRPRPGTTD